MQTITIPLQKREKEHLSRLALRYGLSLPEFSRNILIQLNELFPAESFQDYKNASRLKKSFNRALADWRTGRVLTKL